MLFRVVLCGSVATVSREALHPAAGAELDLSHRLSVFRAGRTGGGTAASCGASAPLRPARVVLRRAATCGSGQRRRLAGAASPVAAAGATRPGAAGPSAGSGTRPPAGTTPSAFASAPRRAPPRKKLTQRTQRAQSLAPPLGELASEARLRGFHTQRAQRTQSEFSSGVRRLASGQTTRRQDDEKTTVKPDDSERRSSDTRS